MPRLKSGPVTFPWLKPEDTGKNLHRDGNPAISSLHLGFRSVLPQESFKLSRLNVFEASELTVVLALVRMRERGSR